MQDFYRNQSVLVTGATGFLGKAVVEKLLRSCSEISTVYILVRGKGGLGAQMRLEKLLDKPVFETLKRENSGAIKKICPLEGDIGLPGLGLTTHDKNALIAKVNVVIHSAASVKFDEPLEYALNLNVLGVKRVVELCKKMTSFKSLVHISTAYSNCDRGVIEEKVYPHPPGGVEIINLLDDIGKIRDNVKYHEEKILKCRPNTYTYTKALAENYLMTEAKSIPLCIVRPSIVTASLKEPVPGWVDNINGATGILTGMGTGVMRLLLLDGSKHINMIPVDVVVNMILCAAMETSLNKKLEFPKVYNCCASTENLIRNDDTIRFTIKNFRDSEPLPRSICHPSPTYTTNRLWYTANDILFQYMPVLFVDLIMPTFSNKKIRLLEMYRKLKKATMSLEFFTLNEWQFETTNMTQLFKNLSEQDQNTFFFDAGSINWCSYLKDYIKGIRRYILKVNDNEERQVCICIPP